MYKENMVSGFVAVAGTTATMFLGGWDSILKALVLFMIADYITGLAGAFKTKTVNSEVMFWGGVRKSMIILVIALAVYLDQLVGNENPLFRTLALYFYIGREGLSVVENLGVVGVPLPGFVKKVLTQLQEKGDSEHANQK
jgi:toxin secretion/phage lysis holin